MAKRKPELTTAILTKKEVAEILKISEGAVAYLAKTHKIKSFVLARKLRFRPEAVEEYIRLCENKGP